MVLLIIMLGIAVSMVRLVIGIMIATEIIVKFVVMITIKLLDLMLTKSMLIAIAIVLELELLWRQLIMQHIIDQQHLLNNLKDNSHRHHSSSS